MELKSQVAIISIFGRGHYLAAKLAKAGVPVALLDVTEQMGTWSAEDAEGPFGFFETEGLAKERLSVDQNVVPVLQGLTIWLQNGPLELKGPATDYRLNQLKIAPEVIEYLQSPQSTAWKLKGFKFRESWLAHFAHSWASPVDTMSPEAASEGEKRPLFSAFSIRQVSQQGLEKSFKWCERQGVQVFRQIEVKDLGFQERRQLGSLEVRTDKPGLFQAEQFVFCLSSEESSMLGQRIQKSLFDDQAIEPVWAWVRYRLEMKDQSSKSHLTRDQIPVHSVLIEDLMLPWTHENLLVLKRDPAKNQFDAWIKIPNNQRFNSQYLNERGEKIKALLKRRLVDNDIEILELPREAQSTFQQLGPARHPVYSRNLRTLRKKFQVGNIAFDSPEFWKSLGWEGSLEHEDLIFANLKAWWDRKEELRLKREAKELAKQNSGGADL